MKVFALIATNISQYEGYRIRQSGTSPIYMILHGKRRWVPNPSTYSNLFGNDNNVHEVLDADIVPDGGQLSDGAILARPKNGPAIYLISNGQKQHVASPPVIDKFGFRGVVREVDHVLIESIPEGLAIT